MTITSHRSAYRIGRRGIKVSTKLSSTSREAEITEHSKADGGKSKSQCSLHRNTVDLNDRGRTGKSDSIDGSDWSCRSAQDYGES